MAAEPANPNAAGWLRFAPWLAVIAVLIAYLPSLDYAILEHDRARVLGALDPDAAAATGFARFASAELDAASHPFYRPLASATYDLQVAAHADWPAALHAVNVLLGAGIVVAVFVLLRAPGLGLDPFSALVGAAVVGFHPIAAACVVDVTGRDALLAAGFAVLGLACFLRGGALFRVLAVACYAGGLASNEVVLLLPAVYAAADRVGVVSGAQPAPRGLIRVAPELAVLALYLLLRRWLFDPADFPASTLFAEPLGPLLSLLYSVQTIVLPRAVAHVAAPAEVWLSIPRLLVAGALLSSLALAASRRWREVRSVVLLALLWGVVCWIPNANLFEQHVAFAESTQLLPLIASVLAGAKLLSVLSVSGRGATGASIAAVLGSLVVVSLVASASQRGAAFADDIAYAETRARSAPWDPVLQFSLGNTLVDAGRLDDAIVAYRRATALDAQHFAAANNLAWLLATRPHAKSYEAREAVRIAKALRSQTGDQDAGVLDTLAVSYAAIGRFERAVEVTLVAISVAEKTGPRELLPDLRKRLGLYRREEVFREL